MTKNNMKYVDGFVLVVPKKNVEAYKKMAEGAGQVWKKHGALDYKECIGEDLAATSMGDMRALTFTELAKPGADEVVVFSYIVYKSRAHRDEVNAKVMEDPFMKDSGHDMKDMPFDMKRMAYGGFQVIADPFE